MTESEFVDFDPLVESNLRLIEEKMPYILTNESAGGNGGKVLLNDKRYSCVVANFYFDIRTGEIKEFGNIQSIPPDVVKNKLYQPGTYHTIWNTELDTNRNIIPPPEVYAPIISLHTEYETKEDARERLLVTAEEYNRRHAPDFSVDLRTSKP